MLERIYSVDQVIAIYRRFSVENNWFWWIEGPKPSYERFEDWVRGCASDPIGLFLHRTCRQGESYVVGFSRMSRTDFMHGFSYLTVWIAPEWRKTSGLVSYGMAATAEIIDFAFHNYPLRKIYHHIVVTNDESLRPAQKVFQCEGILKRHYFFDGQYHDLAIFSVTRDAWKDIFRRYRRRLQPLMECSQRL